MASTRCLDDLTSFLDATSLGRQGPDLIRSPTCNLDTRPTHVREAPVEAVAGLVAIAAQLELLDTLVRNNGQIQR